jgi:hypothetical protein
MSNASEDIGWKEVIKLWVSKVALEQREAVVDPLSGFKRWRKPQGRKLKKNLQRG